jgi:hypothetical protein
MIRVVGRIRSGLDALRVTRVELTFSLNRVVPHPTHALVTRSSRVTATTARRVSAVGLALRELGTR